MHAPTYRWRCHKCEEVNVPGISTCAQCGFPAVASAVDICRARGEPNPISSGYRSVGSGLGWFLALFPWWWW
jgi:hypothetical protein